MSGRITVESVAGCSWNRWPDGRGIRSESDFHKAEHGLVFQHVDESGHGVYFLELRFYSLSICSSARTIRGAPRNPPVTIPPT
ncbi:hypothetical protein C7A13_27745 [Pseudomonas fluorescens]|nr:hypothetical protein C7A13_27745 [Pseudomonas fluorescens]